MQAISLVPRRGVDERPLTRNPSPDVQRQKLKPREKPVWLDGKVAVWGLHPMSAGELVDRIGEAHALRVAASVRLGGVVDPGFYGHAGRTPEPRCRMTS